MDRNLYAELRKLDRHDLRRVLMFVRGLLLAHGDEASRTDPEEPSVTYRLEMVKCGKAGCRSCPHGPYWYAYYREDNRLRSRYVGKEAPAGVRFPTPAG